MSRFFISWLVLLATCLTFAQSQDSWSSWTPCSATCGGFKSRSLLCGTNPCSGFNVQFQACEPRKCCRSGETVYDKCGQRCVCGAGSTLTQCTRIRKEFTSMTTAERQRYVRVIKTMSTDPAQKSRYDQLIGLHKNLFSGFNIHERQHFLTWHRWYILQYENLLREVDCHFTVSYWDWSAVSDNPWGTTASDVWYAEDSGLGGDGSSPNQCVTTGPFRQGVWELVPSAERPRCLKRRFRSNPPNTNTVRNLIQLPASEFNDFENTLRVNLHDLVHCLIDGTMCTPDSASAPEFFLHHSMVDKIWTDWQKNSDSHKNAFFPSVNEALPGTDGLRPTQFLDNAALPGSVRVEYAEIGEGPVTRTVRRSRVTPRTLDKEAMDKAVALFKVSPEEQRTACRMQKIIDPNEPLICS